MDTFFAVNRILEEIHFIQAFSSQQEKQIESYIEDIDKFVETADVERAFQISKDEYEAATISVEHIEGISEEEYDFKRVFTEVMPMYQRQSMLTTLWAKYESSVDHLINHICERLSRPPKNKPKNISIFEHQTNELERLGISLSEIIEISESMDFLIDKVRHIRNSWVHRGGIPINRRAKNHALNHQDLSLDGNQISIGKKYINVVVQHMRVIGEHLSDEILVKKKIKL